MVDAVPLQQLLKQLKVQARRNMFLVVGASIQSWKRNTRSGRFSEFLLETGKK